jgi:predicted SprT family Zn-dependent metalloprotease
LNRNWTERGTKTRTRGTKTRTGTVELERIGLKRNPKKVSMEVEEPLEEIIIHRVSRSI